MKLSPKFAANKFLFWGEKESKKKFHFHEAMQLTVSQFPLFGILQLKKKSSSLSYFCRLQKLCESIVQKDKCGVCCQGYHGTASFPK